jgi:hypothetical protein
MVCFKDSSSGGSDDPIPRLVDEDPRPVLVNNRFYYASVWFVDGAGPVDWLGTLYRPSPQQDWRFICRLRYYNPLSVDPSDGLDEKEWATYDFDAELSQEAVERSCASLADIVAEQLEGEVQHVSVHGNGDVFVTEMRKRSFVHRQIRRKTNVDAGDEEESHAE